MDAKDTSKEVYAPMNSIVPMVSPNDLVISGWDCSKVNLGEGLERAGVFEPDLQRQLKPEMDKIVPLPAIFDLDFVATNQEQRADNVIKGTKAEAVEQVRKDIRDFKAANGLDKVIVLWTANTERYASVIEGVNDTADNMLKSIEQGHEEVSPSSVFAVACILENAPFINGSPQNTFVPGVL